MILQLIFKNLLSNTEFFKKSYPYLKEEYFSERVEKEVYKKIKFFHEQFKKLPKNTDIKILTDTDPNISEELTDEIQTYLTELNENQDSIDEDLLLKKTEEFCQNRALEIAILESVTILQESPKDKHSIEEKVRKALSVEFDVRLGLDFFRDAPYRYSKYSEEEEIIPCGTKALDVLLNGGFRKKAFHCFLGRVNIGKSLWLCHLGAVLLAQGKNVVFVSGEMSEDMISKRIDANLLDIAVNDLNKNLDKKVYLSKIKEVYAKTKGKLIVKEYPTSSANTIHLGNLLNEIKTKRGWSPDVLIVDYLNIFASHKLTSAASLNSYHYIKTVAEEMRALAVEYDLALITASQVNRTSANIGSDKMDMTATSDSFGLPMTADWMCAIIQSPELFEQKKFIVKNIKSRFGSNINQVVTVGVEYDKMRIVDLPEDQQEIPIHLKDKLRQEDKMENDFNFEIE